MNVGVLTWNASSFCSSQLICAAQRRGVNTFTFNFNQLVARVGYRPHVSEEYEDLTEKADAIIVRPISRRSLEDIIFRINLLHKLKRAGVKIINPPEAIERSVDKYNSLVLLEESGLPVPRTAVTENSVDALNAFYELKGDVIVKPLFGSRGLGMMRVSNPDEATRVFRNLAFQRQVIYIQEFIPHDNYDIRAFVLGGSVLASEKRVARSWKTNVSQGAHPEYIKLDSSMEDIAVKAVEVIGCEVAGVDIVEGPEGPFIVEVNSQPGWRGLQSVTQINIAEAIMDYVISKIR
ncbi:MAG: RimK family alpha-L-glutamate ligase [Candidatus Bathyarchaeia archaeon]